MLCFLCICFTYLNQALTIILLIHCLNTNSGIGKPDTEARSRQKL